MHRLDRETSGVVLFGKTRVATAFLARQFERHRVEKEYLLIVHGLPEDDRFTVDAPLGAAPTSRVRKAVGVAPAGEGRAARTDFTVLARGPEHAVLSARPRTGRLHQIRVHARHAGYPVVGDKLYGLDEGLFLKLAAGESYSDEDRARLLLDRQCLHAWRLRLEHPGTRESFRLTAAMPAGHAGSRPAAGDRPAGGDARMSRGDLYGSSKRTSMFHSSATQSRMAVSLFATASEAARSKA